MPVCQHLPEPSEFRRRHPQAGIEHISLKIGLHERPPPFHAGRFRSCRERPWEAAAQPKALPSIGTYLIESEATEFVIRDPPCQALASPRRHVGRGAPQQQELGRQRPAIQQGPERSEQGRQALHFVDHDEAPKRHEDRLRILQQPNATMQIRQLMTNLHGFCGQLAGAEPQGAPAPPRRSGPLLLHALKRSVDPSMRREARRDA